MSIDLETNHEIRKAKLGTPSNTVDDSIARRAASTLDTIERVVEEEIAQDQLPFELPANFLLSVVVPVYNERATVGHVIDSLYRLPVPLEVIVVDDGSTDGTGAELTRLNKMYPQLRVIIQEKNCGKGAALRNGFEIAGGSHIIVQDADFEYQPSDIPSLLEPIAKGEADVVFGSRFLENRREGSSLVHRVGNAALTKFSNWATGLELTDMETGYKVVRRDLIDEMELRENGFGFEVELTSKLAQKKVNIVELPIGYVARGWEDGKKIGMSDAFHALYCIARYGWFGA